MPSDTRDGVVTAAVEHPLPTGATKKFLYAHAFRCACPGCPRPLYSVDGETGARSLNSQIAHICARREGGPRFDLQQSAEENRHETNLLVLCLEHANEVDVAGWETRFPPKLLREWKAGQLRDFDRIQQGWTILDEDLEKVLPSTTVSRDVYVGGAGGAAPGAGGGGGGVVGAGRGGDGGAGGATYNLDGALGQFPGAGGGGGGATGEGAAGGAGGGGGARVVAMFRADDLPDELEIFVGAGGRRGEAGEAGHAGEPAIVRQRMPDGSYRDLLRADGGRAGSLASGAGAAARDRAHPMPVLTFMLANYAETRDGLLFVAGGGWTTWTAPGLPATLAAAMVVTVGAPATHVEVVCYRPDGSEAARSPAVAAVPAGVPWLISVALPVEAAGRWRFELLGGGVVLAHLPLEVSINANAVAHG